METNKILTASNGIKMIEITREQKQVYSLEQLQRIKQNHIDAIAEIDAKLLLFDDKANQDSGSGN